MTDRELLFSRRRAFAAAAAGAAAVGSPMVRSAPGPSGKPRPSDVIFSSRWTLPASIAIAATVHATRFDWTYRFRDNYFASLQAAGFASIGGAINMWPPDGIGEKTYQRGRARDRAGQLIEAPWVRGQGWYWSCVNNPEFRGLQVDRARWALQGGAKRLQHDDCRAAIAAVSFGGCWCQYCRQRAARLGYDLQSQMLAFQTSSTVSYIKELRARIGTANGHAVLMSCNNFRMKLGIPHTLFDYGMCEIDPADAALDVLTKTYREFERLNWMQVVTLRSADIALNRATIARVHALGGAMLYPYNVYMPSGTRFTADSGSIVPFYKYVRAIGALLDESRFVDQPSASYLFAESLEALKRARVGTIVRRAGTQTVLHFVPAAAGRDVPPVDIRVAAGPGNLVLRSAARPDPQALRENTFAIAPWDWTTLTIGT